MKLDRREAQHRPTVYQNRNRGCRQRQDKNYRYRNRPIAEIEVNHTIEEEETFTITEIIGPIIELGVSLEMVMGMEMAIAGIIEMTVDQIIEETITDKTVEIKGIGIEVQVKTAVGLGQDIEAILEITIGTSPKNRNQSRNRDRSSSRDEGQRSRTESRDKKREGSEDLDDSTWQMLSQDGTSTLQYIDVEDLNM